MEQLRTAISECVDIISVTFKDTDLLIDVNEPVCILLLINLMLKEKRLECRAEINSTCRAIFTYKGHIQEEYHIYYPDDQVACNVYRAEVSLREFSDPATRTWSRFESLKVVKDLKPLLTIGNFFCDLMLMNTGLVVFVPNSEELEVALYVCDVKIASGSTYETLFQDAKLTTITNFKYNLEAPLQIYLSVVALTGAELTFEDSPIMRFGSNIIYKMRKMLPSDIYKYE
jgi:hypothetical protein